MRRFLLPVAADDCRILLVQAAQLRSLGIRLKAGYSSPWMYPPGEIVTVIGRNRRRAWHQVVSVNSKPAR